MEVEIAKLQALDQTNLEIWQRLGKGGNLRYRPVMCFLTWRNDSSCITFSCSCVSSLRFQGSYASLFSLSFVTVETRIPHIRPRLEPLNFFNEKLPEWKYKKLDFTKLSLMDITKPTIRELVDKWKRTLELIQVDLGKAESSNLRCNDNLKKIMDLFHLKTTETQRFSHKQAYSNSKLEFSLSCENPDDPALKKAAEFLLMLFDPSK